MESGNRGATIGIPSPLPLAGWTAAGLVLALAGVQVHVSGRPAVNVLVSMAWIVGVTLAFHHLARHETLWPWLTAASSASLAALAAISQQWALAGLGVLLLAIGVGLGLARRPGWVRLVADTGLVGIAAAAVSVLLEFPARPMWGTWMLPLVAFGLPLVSLGWAALGWGVRALGGGWAWGDLATDLARQGYTAAGVRRAMVVASVALGAAAVGMSVAEPFLANLGLAALVGGGVVAARPRAVRRAGGLPMVVYAYAALVLALFVASLRYGFLDFLFSETLSGYRGWDFFLLPQAFDCLANGVSPYLPYPTPEQCGYGPWATPFVLHPLSAIFPGGLLHALPPWPSYAAFVAGSIAALFVLYGLFASLTDRPLAASAIFLALFANWPLYLMLWLGQTHVFTVLAFGLVEFWLLLRTANPAARRDWLLVLGLLISLFSKPIILLFLPALLVAPLTRRPAVLAGGVYALVSAVFVFVPALNPGGLPPSGLLDGSVALSEFLTNGNLYHWGNILAISGGLHTNHRDILVLSTLLNVVLPDGVVIGVSRLLAALTVIWVTWLAAFQRPAAEAAQGLALSGCLIISLYYLSYSFAFEHQYPTLAIVPVVLVLLLPRIQDRLARRYTLVGLAAFVPMLFPTIYRLIVAHPTRDIFYDFSAETLRQMTLYRSFRVIPALIMFAAIFLALRRLRQRAAQPSS